MMQTPTDPPATLDQHVDYDAAVAELQVQLDALQEALKILLASHKRLNAVFKQQQGLSEIVSNDP